MRIKIGICNSKLSNIFQVEKEQTLTGKPTENPFDQTILLSSFQDQWQSLIIGYLFAPFDIERLWYHQLCPSIQAMIPDVGIAAMAACRFLLYVSDLWWSILLSIENMEIISLCLHHCLNKAFLPAWKRHSQICGLSQFVISLLLDEPGCSAQVHTTMVNQWFLRVCGSWKGRLWQPYRLTNQVFDVRRTWESFDLIWMCLPRRS